MNKRIIIADRTLFISLFLIEGIILHRHWLKTVDVLNATFQIPSAPCWKHTKQGLVGPTDLRSRIWEGMFISAILRARC